MANNIRFLILSRVEVLNVAFHLLGQAVKQLEPQWKSWTIYQLMAIGTFVDPQKLDREIPFRLKHKQRVENDSKGLWFCCV